MEFQSTQQPLHAFNPKENFPSAITDTLSEKLSLDSASSDDWLEYPLTQFRASQVTASSPQALRWLESQKFSPSSQTRTKYSALRKSFPAAIDARDRGTPDDWVERSPCILRLTGDHPFNGEPDMSDLFAEGFITPAWMHFTRNHGKAARCHWKTHTLSVKGLVSNPMAFSMDELVRMPSITMPVQVSCAGNRRREVNIKKQTIGFNWGYGAHGCSMWTGVKLSYLLETCGVDMKRGRYIHFNGSTLEGLKTGTFGTSIDLSVGMNPWGDVMVAYLQNGKLLTPDHGFPIRAIVPGFIGGRTVKWLEEIVVSDSPSTSYYHFHDNRILPSHVDAELASKEDWLSRPEYLYNQAQVNSAIASPRNGECLDTKNDSYLVQGFAFSGGGRKITRVEVSLDSGSTWELAETDYPEERLSHAPRNGNYYCWMFWNLKVASSRLQEAAKTSGEMRCRAWDVANNTQPPNFSWNLMGFGNNSHYRVRIIPTYQEGQGKLQFIHPTVAGSSPLGWMTMEESNEKKPLDEVKSNSHSENDNDLPLYTMDEVAKHSSSASTWVVIEGQIYDVTSYLNEHPGGAASILMDGGKDATKDFLDIHSDYAKEMLRDFLVGKVDMKNRAKGEGVANQYAHLHPRQIPSSAALCANEWRSFELSDKKNITLDTKVLTFKLPCSSRHLGVPTGCHLYVEADINGRKIMRAYTPISDDDYCGSFALCVKVYKAAKDPRHLDGGKMSQFLDRLCKGDKLRFRGPAGQFEYMGSGRIRVREHTRVVSSIGLICGGTGITPAYQIIRSVHKKKDDSTQIHLLYASHSESDIILRKELDAMSAERDNIHIWYTVSLPTRNWTYSKGRITSDMIRERIPSPNGETFTGLSGPLGLLQDVGIPGLLKMGYTADDFLVL